MNEKCNCSHCKLDISKEFYFEKSKAFLIESLFLIIKEQKGLKDNVTDDVIKAMAIQLEDQVANEGHEEEAGEHRLNSLAAIFKTPAKFYIAANDIYNFTDNVIDVINADNRHELAPVALGIIKPSDMITWHKTGNFAQETIKKMTPVKNATIIPFEARKKVLH